MNKQEEIQSRILQIANRMEQGARTGELIIEYTQKWECGERTIERYIKFASDGVFGKITNKESILNAVRADCVMELFEHSMLTTYELEARLCDIASGKVLMDRLVSTKEGTHKIQSYPSPQEQLKAINLLLRLRGKLSQYQILKIQKAEDTPPAMITNEEEKKLLEMAKFKE